MVLQLLDNLEDHGVGHVAWVNNLFSSKRLFALLRDLRIGAAGTVRITTTVREEKIKKEEVRDAVEQQKQQGQSQQSQQGQSQQSQQGQLQQEQQGQSQQEQLNYVANQRPTKRLKAIPEINRGVDPALAEIRSKHRSNLE